MTVASFHVYLYGPERSALMGSFEQASARLERLTPCYFEPDGSFVWSPHGGAEQIFGMLYDAAGQLQYVDLRGHCSRETFETMIRTLQPDSDCLEVVVLPEGSLYDLQSFVSKQWT